MPSETSLGYGRCEQEAAVCREDSPKRVGKYRRAAVGRLPHAPGSRYSIVRGRRGARSVRARSGLQAELSMTRAR